jgi:hypothetical protein
MDWAPRTATQAPLTIQYLLRCISSFAMLMGSTISKRRGKSECHLRLRPLTSGRRQPYRAGLLPCTAASSIA